MRRLRSLQPALPIGAIFGLLLPAVCAAQNRTGAVAARIPEFLEQNRQVLELDNDGARFRATLLDTGGKQVILLGETHGVALNEDLDLALLRYLHKTAGVRVYLSESGYSANCLLNRYLDTGDEQVLDFVMQESYGSIGWTREHRAFYAALRRWNLTLPEKERVRLVGLDVEHQRRVALRYLAELAKPDGGKRAPAAIAETIARLQRIQQEPYGKPAVQFIGDLTSSVAAHRLDYAAMLGDRLFDFELTAANLQKAVEYYATDGTPQSFDLREQVMVQTFLKLYPRLGGAKCYGRWGSAHVLQRRADLGVPFAAMLNRPDSPVAGRVVSIFAMYVNSEALSMPGYRTGRADDDDAWSQPFAAASPGPITLFKLTGAGSPFQQDAFSFMKGHGVPTDYVQYVVLIRNATASHPLEVHRARLGIGVQALTPDSAAGPGVKQVRGVLVDSVMPGGPAERAGIRTGDIITALNGTPIDDPKALVDRVFATAPGTTLTLSILRGGHVRQVSAKLEDLRPETGTADHAEGPRLGIVVQVLTAALAAEHGLPGDVRGLLVEEVQPAGPAAGAGVRPGDVIVEINGQPVRSVPDVAAALKRSGPEPSRLSVNRGGQNLHLSVRTR